MRKACILPILFVIALYAAHATIASDAQMNSSLDEPALEGLGPVQSITFVPINRSENVSLHIENLTALPTLAGMRIVSGFVIVNDSPAGMEANITLTLPKSMLANGTEAILLQQYGTGWRAIPARRLYEKSDVVILAISVKEYSAYVVGTTMPATTAHSGPPIGAANPHRSTWIIAGIIAALLAITVFIVVVYLRRRAARQTQGQPQPAVPSEAPVLAYIKECRQRGLTDEQIREELVRAGWQEADISQGFKDVK